jgi:hypothetical protein
MGGMKKLSERRCLGCGEPLKFSGTNGTWYCVKPGCRMALFEMRDGDDFERDRSIGEKLPK